jgi:hypothetical protein
MKGLLIAAALAAGLYLAWSRFGGASSPPPDLPADKTPAANATNRIDNLTGAAPSE